MGSRKASSQNPANKSQDQSVADQQASNSGRGPEGGNPNAQSPDNHFHAASSKFQLLFKKYIDNQLILVVQEQKFPATISLTLVEPSSRLSWKCAYESTTEIVSPSTFSIVDPGSFETFLTIVYDSM